MSSFIRLFDHYRTTLKSHHLLSGSGNIVVSGLLTVTNLGPALQAGDSFQLFSGAGGLNGVFTSILPITPGNGLAWDTNSLAVDGSLKVIPGVVTGPTTNANITKVTLSTTNLIIHGTNNNVPNTSFHYVVLTSTNLVDWTLVQTTNSPVPPFLFVDPNSTNYLQRFYRVLLGP